jgi:hypothetical protein
VIGEIMSVDGVLDISSLKITVLDQKKNETTTSAGTNIILLKSQMAQARYVTVKAK